MNKKLLSVLSAALLLGMSSCSNEDILDGEGQQGKNMVELTLSATRGESAGTRTTVSSNDEYGSLESLWAAGDVVYVYNTTNGDKLGSLSIVDSSITNEKSSTTAQNRTSYASFKGTLALPDGFNPQTDNLSFVYLGSAKTAAVDATATNGKITYDLGYTESVDGLSKWDVAQATGKIQGSGSNMSCAVSFANKVAFGYFSTESLEAGSDVPVNYYSGFTLDVTTGTIQGITGTVKIPTHKKFYMPLIPGQVDMTGDKTWSTQTIGGKKYAGTVGLVQEISFSAAAGYYYRYGKSAATPYGPVSIKQGTFTKYNTLAHSEFSVSDGTKVHFTEGNLQYVGSAESPYWQIATSQYSYFGSKNAMPTSVASGSRVAKGDVDWFGWGDATPDDDFTFLGSTVNSEYGPTYVQSTPNWDTTQRAVYDWGYKFGEAATKTDLYADYAAGIKYNASNTVGSATIDLGSAAKFRTLTMDEWVYLFQNHKWAYVTVTDKSNCQGIVVCPDNVTSVAGLTLRDALDASNSVTSVPAVTGESSRYAANNIKSSIIDDNGLLFLPAAGGRNGASPNNVGSYGNYWSSTAGSATNAYGVGFYSTGFGAANSIGRYIGRSVRLAY